MSIEAWRAASRLVGRRTALRCLTAGVGASLLAACKGNDEGKGKGLGKSQGKGKGKGKHKGRFGTGASSPTPGVTGMAFAAFVRGSWKVTSKPSSGAPFSYSMDIGDGTWSMNGSGKSVKGTWALQGGRLVMSVPEDMGGDSSGAQSAAASNVPAAVGTFVNQVLPWQPPGTAGTGSGQRLEVRYANRVLHISHVDENGSVTEHTCTRA
ncbi:hypothetical protein [Streptomyces puniciscabiei]|uniref:hypothetical protein n=1 Tax=Streptomyces puniciscabiei TaxID=164348 RepID=UPI003326BEDF